VGRLTPTARAAALVAATGVLATAAVAGSAAMGGTDLGELLAWSLGTALVGAAVLALAARAIRRAGLVTQLAVLAVCTTLIVALGAWLGARAMFYSAHDLTVLAILLVAGGTAGTVVAVLSGGRLVRATDDLVDRARRIGDGELTGAAARSSSVELDRLAAELDEASRRLDEARCRERLVEQSRRDLVAWVSHDLRTPLAGLRAITEALRDGVVDDPDDVERYHATLSDEVDQLTSLVDDLFELSRAQSGAIDLELQRLSLTDLVSDTLSGIAPVAASRGVRLEGHIQATADLRASAPELSRALRNILENAVRHTPTDGTVVVEVGRRGEDAFVSVLDGGDGVPPEILSRIFEPGFRGDPARSPGGGAGLGLVIARSFVEAHRGRITVEDGPVGARFTVWLPAEQAG
jgi:signal transduction histidine kinase